MEDGIGSLVGAVLAFFRFTVIRIESWEGVISSYFLEMEIFWRLVYVRGM